MPQMKRHRCYISDAMVQLVIPQPVAPFPQIFFRQFQRVQHRPTYRRYLHERSPQPWLYRIILVLTHLRHSAIGRVFAFLSSKLLFSTSPVAATSPITGSCRSILRDLCVSSFTSALIFIFPALHPPPFDSPSSTT